MKESIDRSIDKHFVFMEAGLNSLESIGWYGETTFTCPICGCASATAKRIKRQHSSRNKATWLYCEKCGEYIHG